MNLSALRLIAITTGLTTIMPIQAWAGDAEVMQLLSSKRCRGCDLRRANLVLADLSGADLQGADLSGANLSQSVLEGANLERCNLRDSSMFGASLRHANLKDADLRNSDLREADLAGALTSSGALSQSHLNGAVNLPEGSQSAAELHNEGVSFFSAQDYTRAESYFSQAIRQDPAQVASWIARGLTRQKLGNDTGSKQDLTHASKLSGELGDPENSKRLSAFVASMNEQSKSVNKPNRGGQILGAAANALKVIAPLAMKAFGY